MSSLTNTERSFLVAFATKPSDKQVCAALSIDLNAAHRIVQSIRGKLGLGMTDSLRAVAKRFNNSGN